MPGLSAEEDHFPRIADYFSNKSVFITGATGFVGSLLLEAILRCCPGIKFIYILLRTKKNIPPEERKVQLFSKKIFDMIKEKNQEILSKVHVISGDVSLPNLGMSEEDTRLLLEEVSIVYHCAASVAFTKPVKYMFSNIVLSLNCVIDLCRRMKKLEVLIYTSTAYSNCNHINSFLREEVYRVPFRMEKFLHAFKNDDNGLFDELVAHCKPDWPNSYTFCKCLAENLIMDTASDLPIAILRPSIIVGTLRKPMPGYQEETSGISAISVWLGKGLIRTLHLDPNSKMNLVPGDIVVNAHLLAACCVGSKRYTLPMIVNCTSAENFHITNREYVDNIVQLSQQYPLPRSFSESVRNSMSPNKTVFYIRRIYHHYLPAIALDAMLRLVRKKPKVYTAYRLFDQLMGALFFFVSHTFTFERTNMTSLNKLMHPEDRINLELDFDEKFLDLACHYPEASPFYDWKMDTNTPSERQKIKHRRHMTIVFIQAAFVIFLCVFISWIYSKIVG